MRGMEPAEHIMPGTSGMAKPDCPMMQNRYIANMTTQRILAICAELGCSEAVAKAYGAGYCPIASRDYFEDAFTFPVYDPRGWSIEAIAAHKPGQGWGWVQQRVGMFRDCLFGPVDDPISGKEKARQAGCHPAWHRQYHGRGVIGLHRRRPHLRRGVMAGDYTPDEALPLGRRAVPRPRRWLGRV